MKRAMKAGMIAVTAIAALAAADFLPQGGSDAESVALMASHQDNLTRPAVLQSMPDEALDCSVETERTFEPSRRAFVMKKVVVCR